MDYFSFGDKVEEEAGKAENALESLYSAMESSLENGFMSMIEGTKSVTDAFRDMARDIIKELYKVLVVQRMVGSVEQGTGLAGLLGKSLVGAGILPGQSFRGNCDEQPTLFSRGKGARDHRTTEPWSCYEC